MRSNDAMVRWEIDCWEECSVLIEATLPSIVSLNSVAEIRSGEPRALEKEMVLGVDVAVFCDILARQCLVELRVW